MKPSVTFPSFRAVLQGLGVFILLCTFSCRGKSDELRLDQNNFEEEIAQEQNLVFTFDKRLVSDSLLNKWDTVPYIKFTPAVEGKFKWAGPDELVFSPTKPFAPSTKYQAELTPNLLKHAEQKYKIPAGQELSFHTPLLALEKVRTFWVQNQNSPNELEASIQLDFNYPVAYAQLRDLLKVYQEQTPLPVELVSSNRDQLTLKVKQVNQSANGPIPLRVVVAKGLTTAGSSYATPQAMDHQISLPTRAQMQVLEVVGRQEEGQESIYIYTSQPVTNPDIQSLVTMSPHRTFTVERLDNGLVLRGDFARSSNYTVYVSGDLGGLVGQPLGRTSNYVVDFGNTTPTLSFVDQKAVYLSSQGSRNIALNLAQVPRIKVTISKVFENNILRFLQEGKAYDGYYNEETEEYHDYETYQVSEQNGKVIYEREYESGSLPKSGTQALLNLDLADLDFDSQFKGLYVLTVASSDKIWMQDSKIISVSDIGLITKQGQNEVMVFANSIRTAEALSGVEVRFISTNNQVVYKATTDQDGVAKFPDMAKNAPDFNVSLITARQGQDFNYLPYSQTTVNTSRFDVGGKRLQGVAYEAFIYGDRDLYRPGDTVHVNTLVRTPDWKTVAGLPIKIKLLLPNGKEYRSQKGTLNQEGARTLDFYLPASAVTGTYTVEVYSGNDVLLNSQKIGVEEFMPDRLKVTTKLNKTEFKTGEQVQVNLNALNLFGPPAAGRNYEVQLTLKKKLLEPKNYADYTFDIKTSNEIEIQSSVRQGQTDAQGNGQEQFDLMGHKDIGMLEGSVFTTVFDETGRPVNRLNRFTVSTQESFFGIKKFDTYVSTKAAMHVPLIALNSAGKPTFARARVQVVRYAYESVIERMDQSYGYNSQRQELVLVDEMVDVPAGGKVFSFTPSASGEYELRVMRPNAYNYVSQQFYAYGWGDTQSTSFEVSKEGEVGISLDKETYEVGEKAKVLFKSPFPGKILVTVEQNKVLSYHYLDTDKKAASFTLPIQDEFLPTVYISAIAIREIKDNSLPMTIARGFKAIAVTKKETKLNVSVIAPELTRSKRTQLVKVKTVPNAQVTLAVVDEGILQLKDFQTPDPHGFFYQKRALEVSTFDLYPYLFPEIGSRRSSVGGDGYDLEKRVNPLTSKRVKLVSIWSGHLKTNANGEAAVNVKVPEFSGSLRVMAVAYKGNAFGSAEKIMRVADPIVLSAALPRFMSPKDTLQVPVIISNTNAKPTSLKSSISVTGPLRVVGSTTKTSSVNGNTEAQVVYQIVAAPAMGQASVVVNVAALGEQFSSTTDITVRPAAPLTKITGTGSLKDAATAAIAPKHDFIPASVASKLVVSSSPLAQFTDDITYLLQYPHGCLEQTTSTAFPLLYYADLARALSQGQKGRAFNPNFLVQEAITKIELMQQYDGGFTYWPGGTQTDWWSTAYATHFLLEAKKVGYPVSQEVLNKAVGYLQNKVKTKATEVYKYYNAQRKVETKLNAAHEASYSLYVLSLAGKPDWPTMNYYKSKPDQLSLDSRYLLASTYALNGSYQSFSQILPKSFAGETSVRALDGSFYSPVRDMALSLNSLVEANPEHPQVGTLSRHLSQELKSKRWYNTQERAFALLALGKLASRSKGNQTAQVLQNGKAISSYAGKDLTLVNKLNTVPLSLQSKGKGILYYYWELEGISQSGAYKQEDSFLKVRKTFFDRNGKAITNNTFKQNDLVIVRVELQSLDRRSIPNVAITDMLPAGFEIENPRLMTAREFQWLQKMDPATPEYMDIRDDRINLYATATPKPQYFFYQVRAVSKGAFQMGPIGADAMYNAEYHSYHGAGLVRVK
ncbi:alpha-2-macroglobulin family protein [Nibribacter ruber]|uniref:Alpha-2-macroglobulin family protein n=1 Tax=Nibribacter ruber TaxID=2698458 RepID=A0A6P1NSK8_9BACT|nr:alpha-2-macroglobulin [Nibribacter ruber]QHL86826.1 alpha-2-macroglobulin family protein [Nibribacter ruber]